MSVPSLHEISGRLKLGVGFASRGLSTQITRVLSRLATSQTDFLQKMLPAVHEHTSHRISIITKQTLREEIMPPCT